MFKYLNATCESRLAATAAVPTYSAMKAEVLIYYDNNGDDDNDNDTGPEIMIRMKMRMLIQMIIMMVMMMIMMMMMMFPLRR